MKFTDRELIYTDRIWNSRSVQTVRSVTKISPSHNGNEIFQVPLMRCNLRTVNSSIRTVSEVHGPYKTLRTETIVSRSVTVRVYWTTLNFERLFFSNQSATNCRDFPWKQAVFSTRSGTIVSTEKWGTSQENFDLPCPPTPGTRLLQTIPHPRARRAGLVPGVARGGW